MLMGILGAMDAEISEFLAHAEPLERLEHPVQRVLHEVGNQEEREVEEEAPDV